ncbi:hypothetical protein KSS87_016252, partial [Heliosperma pusillum]
KFPKPNFQRLPKFTRLKSTLLKIQRLHYLIQRLPKFKDYQIFQRLHYLITTRLKISILIPLNFPDNSSLASLHTHIFFSLFDNTIYKVRNSNNPKMIEKVARLVTGDLMRFRRDSVLEHIFIKGKNHASISRRRI